MAFQSKYKSRWTGPQIDDSIGKIQNASTTPTPGGVAIYGSNGNLKTSNPVADNDTVRLQDITNPNLLINGDFRVNQRGLSSYDAGNGAIYCVDHWWLSQAVFTVATKSLTTTSSWRGMLQYIENWEVLKGKTVTASIKATSGASGVRFGLKTGNTDLTYVDGLVNSTGTLKVSFAIPSNASYTDFRVALWNKGAETTTIEYIKLEIGEIATPFSPRPYSEELAMCQMPFFDGGISTTFSNANLLINGDFSINQKNQSIYGDSNNTTIQYPESIYCVDKWRFARNYTGTYDADTKTLKQNSKGTYANLTQELWIDPTPLIGKALTLSVSLSNLTARVQLIIGRLRSGVQTTQKIGSASVNGVSSISYVVSDDWLSTDIIYVTISCNASGYNNVATVNWAKLEVGEVATPFSPRTYEEELALCQMPNENGGLSTIFSNPNLLLNADFAVNQRGVTEMSGTNTGYLADMWQKGSVNSKVTLSGNNCTIKIAAGSLSVAFAQTIETPNIAGKKITYSMNITNSNIVTAYGTNAQLSYYNGSSYLSGVQVDLNNKIGFISFVATVPANTTRIRFSISATVNSLANETITFNSPKLEVGEVATKFISQPYDENMSVCQVSHQGEGISTTYSNPNLLINGDFKINQRGQSSYTGTKYTVDRWQGVQDNTTVTVNTTSVSVSLTTQYSKFRQLIENYDVLKGKQVTISAKISNYVHNKTYDTVFEISDGVSETIRTSLSNGIICATGIISANATKVDVCFYNFSSTASGTDSFDIEWAKLEVGSVSTPFSPRLYAEELEMCKRYYQKINNTSMIFFARSATELRGSIMYPVEMRVKPTAYSQENLLSVFDMINFTQTTQSAISMGVPAGYIDNKGSLFSFSNFTGLTIGHPYFSNNIKALLTLDAEI